MLLLLYHIIEHFHDVVWYLVEENLIYASKFYWDNSFVKISENIYVNNGYSGNTDDIIQVTDDAVTRDTEFFGEMQYAEDTIIIFCDDKQLLSKLGGDHDTKSGIYQ